MPSYQLFNLLSVFREESMNLLCSCSIRASYSDLDNSEGIQTTNELMR